MRGKLSERRILRFRLFRATTPTHKRRLQRWPRESLSVLSAHLARLFTLHFIRSAYHSYSVASTASCSRPANSLCVRTFARTFYTHPTSPFTHFPARILHSRTMASSSSSNPPPPAERAAEIIDKLPSHPSLITKTGTAILGSGLLATAISQELYVFNEETVIAVGYLILFTYIAKVRLCSWPSCSLGRVYAYP